MESTTPPRSSAATAPKSPSTKPRDSGGQKTFLPFTILRSCSSGYSMRTSGFCRSPSRSAARPAISGCRRSHTSLMSSNISLCGASSASLAISLSSLSSTSSWPKSASANSSNSDNWAGSRPCQFITMPPPAPSEWRAPPA